MSRFTAHWQAQLQTRREAGLLRRKPLLESPQGVHVRLDGQDYISFASNDYLGLAADPRLSEAAAKAAYEHGVGGGASHVVCGHHQTHQALEEELAAFTGRERALVFSSGYMANLAVVSALVAKGDFVFQDKLNHASLIDGGLLSGARFQRYLHNNAESLENYIVQRQSEIAAGAKALVVTDGVFSMDGDIADLPDIASVCSQHEALLMVDDAHGLGVIGDHGRGSCSHFNLDVDTVPVLIGTFGKAFGTSGAFVAGSRLLIEFLEQIARPYIYTTSMSPVIAETTRVSLKIIEQAEDKRQQLRSNIALLRSLCMDAGFELMQSPTAIQPVILGSNARTMAFAKGLRDRGFLAGAIRPPTVPKNTARLRITLSASHTPLMIERLVQAMCDVDSMSGAVQ